MRYQFELSDINTRTQLASRLNVNIKAIDLVSLTTTKCTNINCNLPAAFNNRNKCVLCSQQWFPTTDNRGYGLYGQQFLRLINGGQKTSPQSCCCSHKTCLELGYSHDGMFTPPSNKDDCDEALTVLGVDAERKKQIIKNPTNYRIAPWHYHTFNRVRDKNNQWKFQERKVYKDGDGKQFSFPPPNACVQEYIDNEVITTSKRGSIDDTLPDWYIQLKRIQARQTSTTTIHNSAIPNEGSKKIDAAATPKPKGSKKQKVSTTAPRAPRKRVSPEASENAQLKEVVRELRAQLNSALEHIEGIAATVELKDKEMIQIRLERDNLLEENSELKAKIENIEQQKGFISYDDLRAGGKLSEFVNDFTFFPSFDSVDAFLELINYTEGCDPGDGLCENLRRYSKVSIAERKKYNDSLKNGTDTVDESAQDEDDDAMSISSDAGTGLSDIADEAMEESESNGSAGDTSTSPRSRQRKLSWKDEFLVYCFYAKCNLSMRRTGALFGIKQTLVHDIVYAWANVFFPITT